MNVADVYIDPETGEAFLTPEHFLERCGWRFAGTMPDAPHEYTVRDLRHPKRSTCLSHESFEWFVRHIRAHGDRRRFGERTYTYLAVGDHEYWTMGAPPRLTTVINRQRLSDRRPVAATQRR